MESIKIIPTQKPPKEIEAEFYNRKKTHSFNVQAVCNYSMRFFNVCARWPGKCHDAGILRTTELWDFCESGQFDGIILGDSGIIRTSEGLRK